MSDLTVITPSYAPDAERFADLHRSVLEHTSEQTVHHVIVPPADKAAFGSHAGSRCKVWTYSELLPRRYISIPRAGVWLNTMHPWPPVRGWILQQVVKIAVAAVAEANAVLLVDSDVVLVSRTRAEMFDIDGRVGLHRAEHAVHAGMVRHVKWHAVARRLLGLPAAPAPPLHDYVSPFSVWDPTIVRALQGRISDVTGRNWMDAFTSELHVSEYILYGVFVDEVLGVTNSRPPSKTTFCHNYWDTTPLDHGGALAFADRFEPRALAMMVSAKSHTPREIRLAAARRCGQIGGDRSPGGSGGDERIHPDDSSGEGDRCIVRGTG